MKAKMSDDFIKGKSGTLVLKNLHLPEFLNESIEGYCTGLAKIANGEDYLHLDWDWCNLQNDINVAEVEQMISSETAHLLRKEFLYDGDF